MALFSIISLKKSEDIATLTSTYSLDSDAIVSEYEDFCKTLNIPQVEMNDIPYTANDFSYSGDSKEQEGSGEDIDEIQLYQPRKSSTAS